MKKVIIWIIIAAIVVFVALLVYGFSIIYREVDHISSVARSEYKLNSVESLIKLIESDDHSYAEKNTAIWALGQFADEKALPYFEKIELLSDPGDPCNRQKALCKREIQRAIKWCRKGNATSWMYRKIR